MLSVWRRGDSSAALVPTCFGKKEKKKEKTKKMKSKRPHVWHVTPVFAPRNPPQRSYPTSSVSHWAVHPVARPSTPCILKCQINLSTSLILCEFISFCLVAASKLITWFRSIFLGQLFENNLTIALRMIVIYKRAFIFLLCLICLLVILRNVTNTFQIIKGSFKGNHIFITDLVMAFMLWMALSCYFTKF